MQNEEPKGTRFPKLISNQPSGVDLYEGKSQDRVAESIATQIKYNDDCKIIGIDGGWGTGKSNLIAIVQNKLNEHHKNKFHFFLYDAWGHQEDLKRRSLLEELTFFLTEPRGEFQPILIGEKWKVKLNELLSKSKKTQTKTIPSLSLGIVFAGLVLILTPLFKAISEVIDNHLAKILITASPTLLLIIVFIFFYFKKSNITNGFFARTGEVSKQMFYLYQQHQQQDIKHETISEDEPSVKKFRDWMNAISNDLGGDQLILVFDNMDRLPNSKVLELWSSIHTFFAENTYENIKVIIPFDRQNIKTAFTNPNDSASYDYANDFINKTFNVVYRVSPPILSDWKKFFTTKWIEAFDQTNEEFFKVIQIYDHLSKSKTPRDIVVFINEFVSIVQISNNIPFRYVALFIMAKEVILKSPELEIIKGNFLQSLNFLYEGDEELPKYIASLVYQIEPERAIEVVFTDKLTTALNNNHIEEIQVISESSVFQDILAKSILLVDNYENTIQFITDTIECFSLDRIFEKGFKGKWTKLTYRLPRPW